MEGRDRESVNSRPAAFAMLRSHARSPPALRRGFLCTRKLEVGECLAVMRNRLMTLNLPRPQL